MSGRARSPLRGLLAVTCVALLLPAAAAAMSGTYSGTTVQGHVCGKTFKARCGVSIRIVRNVVKPSSVVNWHARCTAAGGDLADGTSFFGRMTKGRFYVRGSYTRHYGKTSSGAPITARETVTVSFSVQHRTATGWVRAHATVFGGSAVIDHCTTKRIKFVAVA